MVGSASGSVHGSVSRGAYFVIERLPIVALTIDQRAHRQAVRGDVAEVASQLQSILGQRATGAIAGVRDVKAVGKWASGERHPHPDAERRLREALRVVALMLEVEDPSVIRAWFVSLNPMLNDQVPALTIADDPASVMRAARSFVATG